VGSVDSLTPERSSQQLPGEPPLNQAGATGVVSAAGAESRDSWTSRLRLLLQKYRVRAGFVLAFLYFYFSRPSWPVLAAGLAPIVAGLWLRFWASGYIRKQREIADSGPYGHTRNPLYLGSFLVGAGYAIQGGIWLLIPTYLVLFLLIYYPVIKQEEKDLILGFGEKYQEYRRRVPFFWPSLRSRGSGQDRFSWSQAMRNRAYNAVIGAVLAEIILALKILLSAENL
jgi:protein-S-isoprenylcysteine O-methyltransferase Ste14